MYLSLRCFNVIPCSRESGFCLRLYLECEADAVKCEELEGSLVHKPY